MEIRPYGAYVLYDAKKWIPLLLLPLLRVLTAPLVFSSYQDISALVLATIRDTGLYMALVAYSVLRWRFCRYQLREYAHGTLHSLTLTKGLLFPNSLRLSAEDAASVEMECTPLLWLLGGRRVRINTAGLRRRSDAVLYLSAAHAASLMGQTVYRRIPRRYAARLWPVTIMAASSSNAALGLLTLAPALRQAGQIVGRRVSDEMMSLAGRVVSLGLPPLLDSLANVLVLGWAFAFVRNWLRYAGFYAQLEGSRLHLVSGLFTRRDVLIDSDKITALELRQTLFMRLFGLYTAIITAAGYGRDKGTRPVLIPAARPRELSDALDHLIPDYPICSSHLRPQKSALFRYIGAPLWMLSGTLLPLWLGGVWQVLAALWLVGSLWWLTVRLLGFFQAGFGVSRDAVSLCYSKGLALYRVYVPLEVADCAMITQSPWQKRNGTCTVEVRCFGEKRRRHRVFALPYSQALKLAEKLLKYSPSRYQ